MKKLLVLLLAVLLMVSAIPASTFAIEQNDPEFEQFLKEINWSKEDYIEFLESKDWPLEYFGDVSELGTPLSEEGVQTVMTDFDLTRVELNALLVEYGDIEQGEDVLDGLYIIFNEELYMYVDFYLNEDFEVIDENDPEFEKFLEEINWSKEDYLAYLDSKGWPLEYFTDIEQLGTPLSEEGVQAVLTDFDLTREELNELLVVYGDINEGEDVLDGTWLIFNEELYFYVEMYVSGEYEEVDFGGMDIFTEIGLTDEELNLLFDHVMTLNFEDEAFLTELDALLLRLEEVAYFESASELDAAQIVILLDIFNDMTDLFQIDTKYFLTNGEEKQPLSLTSLMTLETTNGYDLLIEIYARQGGFLGDVVLTAEMFGSEIITDTGEDLEVIEEVIEEVIVAPPAGSKADPKAVIKDTKTVKKDTKAVKTAKGAKLPKTASDYVSNALIGLTFVLIGLVLFRRLKTASN